MIDEKIRASIASLGGDDVVVMDNPAFDNSIIGLSTDDRVVYSFEEMVYELMKDENMSYEDAVEFISYNTIRALPYLHNDAPIIMMYNRNDILEEYI